MDNIEDIINKLLEIERIPLAEREKITLVVTTRTIKCRKNMAEYLAKLDSNRKPIHYQQKGERVFKLFFASQEAKNNFLLNIPNEIRSPHLFKYNITTEALNIRQVQEELTKLAAPGQIINFCIDSVLGYFQSSMSILTTTKLPQKKK